MPQKKKHYKYAKANPESQRENKGGIWMVFLAVFMLGCLVAGLYTLQSAPGRLTSTTSAALDVVAEDLNPEEFNPEELSPDEWLIPSPDLEGMEPQVAAVIRENYHALTSDRTSAQNWADYAMILDAHTRYDYAIECYQRALTLDPDNTRWKYYLAITTSIQGSDLDQVTAIFKDVAQYTELYPPIHLRLGNALMQQGKTLEARDAYRYSVELDETFAMGHRGLGQALLALNDIENAIKHLERAVQLSPEDGVSYSSLAQAYTRASEPKKARLAADHAGTLESDHSIPDTIRFEVDRLSVDSVSCASRGERHIKAGEFEQALAEYKRVERVYPDDPVIHMKLAMIYRAMKRSDDVFTHLKKAVKLQDDSVSAHVQLANYYKEHQKLEKAITHYEKAISLKPDFADAHFHLGVAYEQIGQINKAKAAYSQAVEINPDHIAGDKLIELNDYED